MPADDAGRLDGDLTTLTDLEEAWCPILTERFCTASESCGCTAIPGFGEADGACRERVARGCRAQLARFADGVASGDLSVARKLPADCVPALEDALGDCRMPEPDLFTVSCPLVWPRALSRELPGAGASCVEGLCSAGTRCNASDMCAVPKAGAACASNRECRASELCSSNGKCGAPNFEAKGTKCENPEACDGDLSCLASARRACKLKVAGGDCTDDTECTDGEFCGSDGCEPAPTEGQPCGGGVACAAGLGCQIAPGDGQDTCQPVPMSGEPCALGRLGPFICSTGLACRNRSCGPIPGEGETCAVGAVLCADDLGCHVENEMSVCRARVGEGAPCGLDDSCKSGLYCNFRMNRCASWLAPGTACSDGNECGGEGACVPDDFGAFRCVARPGKGEACFLDTCTPGFVCASPYEAGACAPPMCAAFQF